MSKYRKIDPRIWNDAKFRSLSDNGKLVFFMVLTHPSMTALGAMRATMGGLAEEIGWRPEAFREAFAEASSKGMLEHDGKAHLVALPNFIKYNPPESPNVVKAWVGALDHLPECELKSKVIQRSVAFARGLSKGFAEALPEEFAKTMPYQEQEQEQEPEQEKKKEIPLRGSAVAPLDLSTDAGIFAYGKSVLGKSAGGVINKLVKHCDRDLRTVASYLMQASEKENAMEWVQGVLRHTERPKTPDHILIPDDIYRGVL
ncbi:hypothetical protein CHELA1G11_10630 [Hyphomicrobiales bacterium]|nr:hypothetical protein CHELA1G11_10630 [Hyphomicrobiales bacterium]CAH1673322.1 hypothetical protein CHELA1G2_13673 [Hyphomicrobiales bacterium]